MVLQTRLVVLRTFTEIAVILFLNFHLNLLFHVTTRSISHEELTLCRVNLRKLIEIINNLESFRMFFRFVKLRAVLESFEVCPQHSNPVEKMDSKVKIILFAQPQLIVIVI